MLAPDIETRCTYVSHEGKTCNPTAPAHQAEACRLLYTVSSWDDPPRREENWALHQSAMLHVLKNCYRCPFAQIVRHQAKQSQQSVLVEGSKARSSAR